MSKKDYVLVADCIKSAQAHQERVTRRIDAPVVRDTAQQIAHTLAQGFARENPRFDRERFMSACGFGAGATHA